MPFAPLVVLGGPTGTGKTPLAIALAEALSTPDGPIEIVSADSRQVYRGLDVGTAKAGPAERARVVHHGLDLVDPDQPFSVADFRAHALEALGRLGSRSGIGILAGGTGFWLRAVARGLDTEALPADPVLRASLEVRLAREGLAALAADLVQRAPALASGVDLRNPRRVVRALEIATLVGDRPRPPARGYPAPVLELVLDVEPAAHRERLAARARAQFGAGLIEEARALRERFDPALPALSAIGYREAWDVLDGRATVEEAIEAVARRNVQFAKRQRTWFRREPGERIDATIDPYPSAHARARAWLAHEVDPAGIAGSGGLTNG